MLQRSGDLIRTEKKIELICHAADKKKAAAITIMLMREKSSLCDAFVVMDAPSTVRVKAIVDSIDGQLEKKKNRARAIEGYADGRWVVLDYGDVIVHVFHEEVRRFYNIENLWGDVPQSRFLTTAK